jgi:F-type H+-transporting ATPase subunit a
MRALIYILLLSGLFIFCNKISGQTSESPKNDSIETKSTNSKESKFAPGEFMLEHITDKHEWHIITFGKTQISIPLPIILYSKISGWNLFLSSKFQHGTKAYNNFEIASEGSNKGKIVEKFGVNEILPFDLSFTKVAFSLFLGSILIVIIFISVAKKYENNPNKPPKGLQSALEPMILFVRDDIAKPSIGDKGYEKFMPYLLTLFFFVWFNNMLGLIPIFPGGANVTGNIAVTMVLAIFTFVITTINANKHYWQEIYNAPGVPWWLKFPVPLLPLIELMGVFLKPLVLTIRLFANMTAGHLVGLAFISLIFIFSSMNPYLGYGVSIFSAIFSVFMLLLEFLVALIQAYVFTLLSAIYFGLAIAEPHGAERHH